MKVEEQMLVEDLGLTQLEASVYMLIITNPEITGYKVSKLLDKPVPNTYKALQSLKKRGMLSSWSSERSEKFFALPIEEYLEQVETEFARKRKKIESLIKNIQKTPSSSRIYEFEHSDQLFSRTENYIDLADKNILIDASPKILHKLKQRLQSTQTPKLKVFAKIYNNETVENIRCFVPAEGDKSFDWNFEWLVMTVDGQKLILAFMEKDSLDLLQAFWSESVFLAMQIQSGLAHEFILSEAISQNINGEQEGGILETVRELKEDLLLEESLVGSFLNKLYGGLDD